MRSLSRIPRELAALVIGLVLLLGRGVGQQTPAAFIRPTSGQVNFSAAQSFQWTSDPSALAYYLYVGTSQGAKDVVDTGEISATTWTAPKLPVGSSLWARIWTKYSTVWMYQDISFTTAASAALVAPLNGQQNVSANATFQWASAPGALAYYLYVGTTAGANDVVNTGEVQGTSFTPKTLLPVGATLWARIYTELDSGWTYQSDIKFTVSEAAILLSPSNGRQDLSQASIFQWTSAPGALAYYLYVGTTQGAKDIVDTGEIQATSYTPKALLPAGANLWARIYTKFSTGWKYQTDVSFTVSAASILLSPSNGQQDFSQASTFQWTSAPGALAYYLYVGTMQGAKDVVDTGEVQTTSYTPKASPPAGANLWARIYTKFGTGWKYQADVNFTVSAAAMLLSPTNGQQNVSATTTFEWTAVPTALAYYLYVGTKQGAKDIADTGEIQATSLTTPTPLPAGTKLWARIYTKFAYGWKYQGDVTFTVSAAAILLSPANGQHNVDTSQPFQWSSGINVQAYYLYIGTSPGAKDLVDTGETQATSWSVPPLPVGETLYARIWTKVNGAWLYAPDVAFTAALRFGSPAVRSVGIDPGAMFSWSAAYGGNSTYDLSIGTSPGANDLYENDTVTTNRLSVPASVLPSGKILYARIRVTPGDGTQRRADTVFTIAGTPVTPATIVYPADGDGNTDVSLPFQWTPTDLAQGYRVVVSTGSTVVLDTGVTSVPRYFDEALPLGWYTGQLGTEIGGQWYWTNFAFTVTQSGSSMANETASALWATDYVRHMADRQNYPYAWTALANATFADNASRITALCNDYRDVLLGVLSAMNVSSRLPAEQQPRQIGIDFTSLDTHTLVEFWNTDQQRWMLLDPTFDLTMTRASDNSWATKEDVNAATLSQRWGDISYQPLGDWGDSLARAYYIDYPLLFLNLPPLPGPAEGQDPMPYLVPQGGPPLYEPGLYTFQCSGIVTILLDGVSRQINCTAVDSLSVMTFVNSSVALPDDSTAIVNIYRPVRNVF